MQNKVSIKKEQVVYRQGEDAHNMYILSSGKLVGLIESEGRVYPSFICSAPAVIGEEILSEEKKYKCHVLTLEDCAFDLVSSELVDEYLDQAPSWSTDLIQNIVDKFEDTLNAQGANRIIPENIEAELNYSDELEIKFQKIINETE
jgi:CRP-like cAMP-binding protein